MSSRSQPTPRKASAGLRLFASVVGALLAALGADFLYGGTRLLALGGSPYYLIAGAALVVTAVLLVRLKTSAAYVYAALFLSTSAWAFWEVGFRFWPLVARLGLLALFGLLIALCVAAFPDVRAVARASKASYGIACALAVGLVATFVASFQPIWLVKPHGAVATAKDYNASSEPTNWTGFGRGAAGTQFFPGTQIDSTNVAQLEVAWTLHTGDMTAPGAENQNTPLQIGNMLYPCTQSGQVFAVRGTTGEKLWHFDPKVTAKSAANWLRCRSLAYYDVPGMPENATGRSRLYVTTGDMRLIALDAKTGQPVASFGAGGTVTLETDMGPLKPGFYNPTSGPLLAGSNLLVGGWVMDNQSTDEPSGVVRAFDAVTGKLAWAWDVGRPGEMQAPAAGQSYTRGTPNVWATPTYDAALNLVYLPTGGGTPDLYGGQRSEATNRVSQSVVALDATTGQERWTFQLVHHDLWDYDLPSKPVLYDMPDGTGGRTPALVQAGKNGQIYVLDRRTGKPLTEVVERPVPTDGVAGETVSPTQPYSVGMPSMRDGVLNEAGMWGITPIDQLDCRIQFKALHYEGDYTPPQMTWYLENPSWYGTTNWGGQSIDKQHDIMIVNDMRIMMKGRLMSRAETNGLLANKSGEGVGGVIPMSNTPYGAERGMVQSFLGVPCTEPPFGTMAAIDMTTRQMLWHRSLGTPEQFGPLGMKTHLPIELGMPTLGGAVTTGSGLIFFSATSDYYLRALDVMTGKVLWKNRLPVGGGATPLVFTSPEDGRQYVVVTAGGSRAAPDHGDYIIAYALPKALAARTASH